MRKYGVLVAVTILVISGILTIGSWLDKPATEVTVFTLDAAQVEKKVTCTGVIEAAENKNIYLDVSCVADEVYVKSGQRVKKGDVLFTVDMEATKDVLATMGGEGAASLMEGKIKKEIVSPANGVLTSLNVKSGSLADSSKPCAVVSSSDELQVKIAIHEKDIKNIEVGQKVQISGTAFKEASYPGVITEISPSARQQYMGTILETVVDAIVLMDEKSLDDSLRLGLSARADIVVSTLPDALTVPYECVLQDEENQEYVYLLEKGRSVKRVIKTGEEFSNGYSVVEGLQGGEKIVTNPGQISKDGEPVTVSEKGA